eukprot:8135241-Ditylum_brightwellii.AAC.1
MKTVTEHVSFQLPNEFMRVRFLLVAIKCSDVGLQAVMANIKNVADEKSATSKRHHFELAVTYPLSFCPVLRKFPIGTKHNAIEISDTKNSRFGAKPSAGTSGVNM